MTPRNSSDKKNTHLEISLTNQVDGVCEIGEVIKAMLPSLAETGRKFQAHCDSVRAQIEEYDKEHCLDHPEEELPVDVDKSIGASWQADKLVVHYLPCRKCVEERGAASVNEKLKRMGIPDKVLHATFDNFKVTGDKPEDRQKALDKFKRQAERGNGFIIGVGTVGTGKTHLAAATIKRRGAGLFITQADLIGALRKSYDDQSQEELVKKYRRTPIFALDELTSEIKGVDIAPFLYRILADRYDKGLLTIITSNEDIEKVKEILGERLVDRMKESFVIANFTWESARKAA